MVNFGEAQKILRTWEMSTGGVNEGCEPNNNSSVKIFGVYEGGGVLDFRQRAILLSSKNMYIK